MIDPVAFLRRTPMRRLLEQQVRHGAICLTWPWPRPSARRRLAGSGIADLSPLPRLGFKGRGTVPAMQKRGITLEAKANQAYRQADGRLCLVLAPSEVILLSNLKGDGEWLNNSNRAGASRTRSALIRYCAATAMPGSR